MLSNINKNENIGNINKKIKKLVNEKIEDYFVIKNFLPICEEFLLKNYKHLFEDFINKRDGNKCDNNSTTEVKKENTHQNFRHNDNQIQVKQYANINTATPSKKRKKSYETDTQDSTTNNPKKNKYKRKREKYYSNKFNLYQYYAQISKKSLKEIELPFDRAVLLNAIDKQNNIKKIIKIINKKKALSAFGEAWENMIEYILSINQHKNLMKIYDIYDDGKNFYLIMEKLRGKELFTFLVYKKQVKENVCKYIMLQILQAVNYLHYHNIIHRDIKPENLMFRNKKRKDKNYEYNYELVLIDYDTCQFIKPQTYLTLFPNNSQHYKNDTPKSDYRTNCHTQYVPIKGEPKTSPINQISHFCETKCTTHKSPKIDRHENDVERVDKHNRKPFEWEMYKKRNLEIGEKKKETEIKTVQNNGSTNDISPSKSKHVKLVGTYGYIAPEIIKGLNYSISSDIWSIGIILYILITGVTPLPMCLMINYRNTKEILMKKEKKGINFNLLSFNNYPLAKDLCQQFLQFDPTKRIKNTIIASYHPWLRFFNVSNKIYITNTYRHSNLYNTLSFYSNKIYKYNKYPINDNQNDNQNNYNIILKPSFPFNKITYSISEIIPESIFTKENQYAIPLKYAIPIQYETNNTIYPIVFHNNFNLHPQNRFEDPKQFEGPKQFDGPKHFIIHHNLDMLNSLRDAKEIAEQSQLQMQVQKSPSQILYNDKSDETVLQNVSPKYTNLLICKSDTTEPDSIHYNLNNTTHVPKTAKNYHLPTVWENENSVTLHDMPLKMEKDNTYINKFNFEHNTNGYKHFMHLFENIIENKKNNLYNFSSINNSSIPFTYTDYPNNISIHPVPRPHINNNEIKCECQASNNNKYHTYMNVCNLKICQAQNGSSNFKVSNLSTSLPSIENKNEIKQKKSKLNISEHTVNTLTDCQVINKYNDIIQNSQNQSNILYIHENVETSRSTQQHMQNACTNINVQNNNSSIPTILPYKIADKNSCHIFYSTGHQNNSDISDCPIHNCNTNKYYHLDNTIINKFNYSPIFCNHPYKYNINNLFYINNKHFLINKYNNFYKNIINHDPIYLENNLNCSNQINTYNNSIIQKNNFIFDNSTNNESYDYIVFQKNNNIYPDQDYPNNNYCCIYAHNKLKKNNNTYPSYIINTVNPNHVQSKEFNSLNRSKNDTP
ncbi:calcium/calmodulin-dependent protein kinase, putative [Plasmodium chabaudi chabaudi]|uniref:Calcium/calmodulin-dependent protein kinase, putative n=1 Tax=Plasmodium chabaudi chabaudi TaxID=31271 RepID=A0A1C6YEG5_PLACU|nr:calcium/calmodulin-dependent protein kinase, putative [Plasmodium chabaudi chabaudi]